MLKEFFKKWKWEKIGLNTDLVLRKTEARGGIDRNFFFPPYDWISAVCTYWSVTQSCMTPWTSAHQTSLSFTISWSLLKFISIVWLMQINHLILCHLLLLLSSVLPSINVFSSQSALCIRWPKFWSFSFSVSSSSEYSGLIFFRIGLIFLLSKGFSRVISRTAVWKHQFFGTQPFLWSNSHILTWLPGKP